MQAAPFNEPEWTLDRDAAAPANSYARGPN
jgi:hypothetical protein